MPNFLSQSSVRTSLRPCPDAPRSSRRGLIDLSALTRITAFSDPTLNADSNGITIDLTSRGGDTIRFHGVAENDLDEEDFNLLRGFGR